MEPSSSTTPSMSWALPSASSIAAPTCVGPSGGSRQGYDVTLQFTGVWAHTLIQSGCLGILAVALNRSAHLCEVRGADKEPLVHTPPLPVAAPPTHPCCMR